MLNVNINPKVLKWARLESGYEEDEIALNLKISKTKYSSWENYGQNIPLSKLRVLSSKYKRQLAVFFLEEIPEKTKKPKDYRNLNTEKALLSKTTLLAMRRVKRYQQTAKELNSNEYWERKYNWLNELSGIKISDQPNWLRTKLGLTIEDQFMLNNSHEALKIWRNRIEENLGILVFQFSMPFNEVQGFCYTDTFPYCIVINTKHTANGRIFGLFHELAHIFHHQSGICLPDNVISSQKVEIECNEFAAETLLPSKSMIVTKSLKEIIRYSTKFKISSEVYLRRLYSLNLIEEFEFFKILDEIKSQNKIFKKGFAVLTPVQKSKNSRGETFYNLINDSALNSKLTFTIASDLLGLKVKNLLTQ